MSPHRYASLHYFLRGVILISFAMLIVFLVKSENILLYIAPRMVDYVKYSAIGLYAIAVYQVYLAIMHYFGKGASCECEHLPSRSLFKNVIMYGLFIFPLLLGFLLPNATMGSSLAAKKGMNLNSSNMIKKEASAVSPLQEAGAENEAASPSQGSDTKNETAAPPQKTDADNEASSSVGTDTAKTTTDAELQKMFPSDIFTEYYAKHAIELYKAAAVEVQDESYMETLTTVDLYLDHFIGKPMRLKGFVYREDTLSDNQFVVGRFALQCCSADAAPYGVLVDYSKAKSFDNDTWVEVTGTIGKTTLNDMDIMKLDITQIEKIDEPESPYVYPNYEFGL